MPCAKHAHRSAEGGSGARSAERVNLRCRPQFPHRRLTPPVQLNKEPSSSCRKQDLDPIGPDSGPGKQPTAPHLSHSDAASPGAGQTAPPSVTTTGNQGMSSLGLPSPKCTTISKAGETPPG